MKAKYLLRGLGLGVIITAVVMGAYTRSAVADARVDVLKEYGIGEEAVLAETSADVGDSEMNAREDVAESDVEERTTAVAVPYNEELESEIDSVLDAAETMESGLQESAGFASAAATEGQGSTVTIEISSGDDSGTVARKLFNAGLVENAAEYDAFLMQHGYDKKLNPGTKTIDAADSWQDIAEKLTKR